MATKILSQHGGTIWLGSLVKALEDYKSGERKNPIMAGFAAGLSRQDREDLAAYFASQSGSLTVIKYTK